MYGKGRHYHGFALPYCSFIIQLIMNMVCMANDFCKHGAVVGITNCCCARQSISLWSAASTKRFVSLIYMTILGLVFLIMGNWYLLPYYILVGVICEVILWKNGWESKKKLTAAWTVSSLLYNGVNLLPIWFFWDTYEALPLQAAWANYIAAPLSAITPPPDGWRFIILFTTICGFLSSLIGGRLINKHFKKAGVL